MAPDLGSLALVLRILVRTCSIQSLAYSKAGTEDEVSRLVVNGAQVGVHITPKMCPKLILDMSGNKRSQQDKLKQDLHRYPWWACSQSRALRSDPEKAVPRRSREAAVMG